MSHQPNIRPPRSSEYFEYYAKYVSLVPEGDIFKIMESQISDLQGFFANVAESDSIICHHPYTWTIRQVVGHLIDTERAFSERLHRFAFGDLQPVPGFDQDAYVAAGDYQSPTLRSLVSELLLCRQSNLLLIKRIRPEAWDLCGTASGYSVTVRALAWMLVGHITHHMQIIRQRLASDLPIAGA